MGVKKRQILKKISDVDDKILEVVKGKPKIHPEKLTVKELKEVLKAFETLYKFFVKIKE